VNRWLVVLAGCAFFVAAAPSAHAGTVTAECFSPTPSTPTSCASWHNQPVSLKWETSGIQQNCQDLLAFKKEGESSFSCTSLDPDGSGGTTPTTGNVTLRIDLTPPSIVGTTASRAPDVNGWWNHPVGFTFAGTDSLSHIANCDTVSYSGPGGPGAVVTGGCHDVAGNYGVASYPLNYDSTPPVFDNVKATPESQSATISWNAPDAVRAQVTRTAGAQGSAARVVYSGPGNHFTDSGITNGKMYTYKVTVFDAADNSSARTVHAKPAISLGLTPRKNARVARPPRLRWPAIRHASYYNVQLWRGDQKLLTVWPKGPHLKLRRVLHFHGVKIRLRQGRYRWYVWPGYGSRAAHRYGSFIGQSSFVLTR
jgi:hypothetical protein